jgi:hypothetical protein
MGNDQVWRVHRREHAGRNGYGVGVATNCSGMRRSNRSASHFLAKLPAWMFGHHSAWIILPASLPDIRGINFRFAGRGSKPRLDPPRPSASC